VAALLLPAYLGGWWSLAAYALISVGAIYELSALLFRHPAISQRLFVLVLVAFIWLISQKVEINTVLLIASLGLAALLIRNLYFRNLQISKWIVIFYPAIMLPLAYSLNVQPRGFSEILFFYGVIEIFDAASLLAGKLFGKRLAFPKLSPRKTIEGLTGGLLGAGLSAYFINAATNLYAWKILPGLVILLVILAILGDLVVSAIKREANVRDSSNLTRDYGGVLDIYDSFIFATPFYFGYCTYLR